MFRTADRAVVETFTRKDPDVVNGLVARGEVRNCDLIARSKRVVKINACAVLVDV